MILHIAYYLVTSFLLTYALWIFYIAVMNLKRVRDEGKLSQFATVLGYPVLFIGLVLDLAVNVLVMTPLLMELPQEMTVTSRLKRHRATSDGWRLSIVMFLKPILDPFDPSGTHI